MLKYLHDIDLNLLVTFRTFVETGSVAATAKSMGRSQPAISSRLKQLQEEMGATLLEKHGRRLQLTSVGRSLDGRLEALLSTMAVVVEEVRAATEEPIGRLRIGVLPTAHVHLLAPRLAELTRAHPRIRLDLVPGHVVPLLASLNDGALDAVLGVGTHPGPRLTVDVVAEARAVVASCRGRFSRQPSRKELRAEPWIDYGPTADPFFESAREFQQDLRVSENVVCAVSHLNSMKALIAAGAGIGILPDYTISEDPRFDGHKARGLDIRLPIWLAVRPGSKDIPSIAALRTFASADS